MDRSTQALPLTVRVIAVEVDQEAVAEARKAVAKSIDGAMPVQYGGEEDGLIVGYQKGGAEWICYHPMRDGGTKPFIETDWPWAVSVYGPAKERVLPRKEFAVGALEHAVRMAHSPEADSYHVGFTAWREYISRLKYLLESDAQARAGDMMGNAWIYQCLVGFRACAATYLRNVAGDFPEDAAAHLMKAAALYNEMSGETLRDEGHCVTAIAPYPWSLKEGETWSDETLRDQTRRLEEAAPIEREAIGEIEAALVLIREGG